MAAAAHPALGRRALPPSAVAAPAAMLEPLPTPPLLDLPRFPSLDVADISVEFTFDQTPVAADAPLLRRDEELWTREPLVVASLPLVRQAAHRDRLSRIEYDLVIVDEAHVLKKPRQRGLAARERSEEALPAATERDARRQQSDSR